MPHSVSPEAQEPAAEPMATDVDVSHDASEREEEDQDHDMAMIETSDESDPAVGNSAITEASVKPEVKLEDLFADVESDEEFPSSNAPDIKMSTSPEAPVSPMLVVKGTPLLSLKLIRLIETWVLLRGLLIQKSCGPSTSVSFLGDISFNGSIILRFLPMTSDIASLHLHYKMMPICATSHSPRQICKQ